MKTVNRKNIRGALCANCRHIAAMILIAVLLTGIAAGFFLLARKRSGT